MIAQELTCHLRKKQCTVKKEEDAGTADKEVPNDNRLTCSMCDYQTASQAELIYHRIMRHGSKSEHVKTGGKVACPSCDKSFRKPSLLCHLRKHTNERIFQCPKCGKGYTRKYNLVDHMKCCSAETRPEGGGGAPAVEDSEVAQKAGGTDEVGGAKR